MKTTLKFKPIFSTRQIKKGPVKLKIFVLSQLVQATSIMNVNKSYFCSEQDFQEYMFIKEYRRRWTVFICSINAALSVVAVFGNAAILIALFQCRSIHSSTKAIFYSLAFSDFGVGMIAQPLQIATGTGVLQDDLNLFCSIQPIYATVAYFFCSVSFMTITAISIDRYFALHYGGRYRLVVTGKKFTTALTFVWIGSVIWAISRMWNIRVNKISAIFIGFLSMITSLLCYLRIYWTMKVLKTKIASRKRSSGHKRNNLHMLQYKRSVNSMLYVFVFLVACYIPYFCSLLAVAFLGYNVSVVLATNLTTVVIFLNSSLNPFVYCWRIREIRVRVRSIVRKTVLRN